ncbi:exocyst complex component 6B-like isoform X2 [Ornithodoros turicata]|uniref:exocyst complex component 6B-like isoform X2 n=1 Tax=Ornithodoros turicata TaxID=34597 RepID=UPI00313A2D03
MASHKDCFGDSMTRLEYYITELETGGGIMTISPVTRSIYDGDEHHKFLEKLDERIRNHDREIEKMCNFHYQGFIDCIRELLQVRSRAQKLKNEVTRTDQELQDATRKVMQRADELVKYGTIQSNIAATIASLSICLPVLEMYAKLAEQMKSRRYYPALKTIEQLEHTYLPRVARHRFAQAMAACIPRLHDQIKEASLSELKDFLESIRRHSGRIGEAALRQAPGTALAGPQVSADDEPSSAQDLVDFSPVYRCHHIYTVLGSRETFEDYYRKQRQHQARLALQPPTNMHETSDGYRQYFAEIVGFFVVEDHILNTASGLVNQAYLDQMWDNALSKITASLRTHSAYCTEASLVLQVKKLIRLFSQTLRSYGYHVAPVQDLLLEIQEHYNEILMKHCVQTFRNIFEDDSYHPIEVSTPEEYQAVLDTFPFRDAALEAAPFPKKFPFSRFVPEIFGQVKEFIQECLKFSEDLNVSQTEVEDMVRKATNLLLTRTLSGCLSTLIKKPNVGLLQLIQITINTNYLEDASVFLEEFISSIFNCSGSHHVAKLQGRSMFKDARKDAEDQIYEQLKAKIDEFLELAHYDWLLVEPDGQASSYMMDLIAFLNNVFQAFTNLPDNVAQTACMTACQHLANSLLGILTSEETKYISMGALEQFNLDVIQCEQFASSEPVSGFKEGALQMFFTELRQLLDLFMSEDWSTYFHDYSKETSRYLRVSAALALQLLEKVREADKKKNLFSSLKQKERDKKKLQETVLRQLRQLVSP